MKGCIILNTSSKLNKTVKIAVLSAIAGILMFLEFPIIPAFEWLKLDFSELPVLMGAFALGPISGVIIEAIKILIKFFIQGSMTGGVGELANFIMGVAFILPVSIMYKKKKDKSGIILGIIIGLIVVNIVAALTNVYMLIPIYTKFMPSLAKLNMKYYVLGGLIPLNTIKYAAVSVITFLLYKKLASAIFKVDNGFHETDSIRQAS